MVFDVRQLPLSRKKGFSKAAFKAALGSAGIDYVHLPVFGCPRPIRDRYKIDGDWKRYEKAFDHYLEGQSESVSELARIARRTSGCLVCFEADYTLCHRSLVARAVALAGGPRVIHLSPKAERADLASPIAA